MNRPTWLTNVMSSFEAMNEPFMEIALAEAIAAASKLQGDLCGEDRLSALAEWSAFDFMERPEEDSMWNTYFAPMVEATDANGSRIFLPDLGLLGEWTIAYWEERLAQTTNVTMRARYADCVWDLERVVVKKHGPRKFRCAIAAVEAYIQAVENDGFVSNITDLSFMPKATEIEGVHRAARAIRLSLRIGNQGLAERAADALIAYCDRHRQPRAVGIWLAPFDEIHEQSTLFSPQREAKIITDLESMLQSLIQPGEHFDPFGAQAAAERLVTYYDDAAQTRRLVQTFGNAFEEIAADASPTLAVAWLQPIIERYEAAGMRAAAERVSLLAASKGKDFKDDFRKIEVEVKVDYDKLEAALEDLLAADSLEMILLRIGLTFVPSEKNITDALNLQRSEFPLISMITHQVITESGFVTATVGSIDEDPEGRALIETARRISLWQPFLRHCLEELVRRNQPSEEEIVDVLYKSVLFSPRRRRIFIEGIRAYLENDFLKAIHLLVPQVESALRTLMAQMGIPTTRSGKRKGTVDEKNLTQILEDARVKAKLGTDRWRYIKAVFNDRAAFNLRNDLSHGLLNDDVFRQPLADLVFHTLLLLSGFRVSYSDESQPE